MTLIQIGALVLVCLLLGLKVIRPLLSQSPIMAYAPDGHAELADAYPAQTGAAAALPAPGRADDGAEHAEARISDGEALRLAIAAQPERSVAMLRAWLAEGEAA